MQMKPNHIEDIIALVALYRPGPMSNIPIYNDCKHGRREPDYLRPLLKDILKPTWSYHLSRASYANCPKTIRFYSRSSRYFKACYG